MTHIRIDHYLGIYKNTKVEADIRFRLIVLLTTGTTGRFQHRPVTLPEPDHAS